MAPRSSSTLGSLGPSYQRRHKSRVSIQGPLCAHGVLGTPHREVCNTYTCNHLRLPSTTLPYTLSVRKGWTKFLRNLKNLISNINLHSTHSHVTIQDRLLRHYPIPSRCSIRYYVRKPWWFEAVGGFWSHRLRQNVYLAPTLGKETQGLLTVQ